MGANILSIFLIISITKNVFPQILENMKEMQPQHF